MGTQYYVASSLDGFIADSTGSLDWLMQFGDPSNVDPGAQTFMSNVGAACMGAGTYRWLIDHVISAPDNPPTGFETLPTWVFTHRNMPTHGLPVSFTADAIPAVHAQMVAAAGAGNVWIVGGGDLAGQFADHGLLDEIIVSLMPVTLGAGSPLLPRQRTTPMTLVSAIPSPSSAVMLTYRLGD